MKVKMLLLAGVFAAAQSIGPSAAITVSGEVTDTGGNPVAGARMTFANEARSSQLFSDFTKADGTYRVVLEAVTAVERGSISPLPAAVHLFQNYPNPFNPSTLIPYQVGATAHVRLRIYNLSIFGRKVTSVFGQSIPGFSAKDRIPVLVGPFPAVLLHPVFGVRGFSETFCLISDQDVSSTT